jgi:NADPH2:quinone reductase
MDAAVLHMIGKPPRCEQFPEPIAGEGEVIVHVHAASLKPIDKQLASGSFTYVRAQPPGLWLGRVGHLSDGQRVFSVERERHHGAMATRLCAGILLSVPEGVDDETAAAPAQPRSPAWLSLAYRARLVPGAKTFSFSVRPV